MSDNLQAVVGIAGALLMVAGFALQGAGMVRAKNASGMGARYLCALAFGLLGYWALGMAIDYSSQLIFGLRFGFLLGIDLPRHFVPAAGLCAVLIAAAIIPGVLAERARFWPALWSALLLGTLIIPISRLWVGVEGWLFKLKFIDAAGAATIHWPAAVCALVGVLFVGPREGKFHRDGSSAAIPGHAVPLASVGAFIILAGWTVFVGASTGGLASFNVLLGGAAGAVAALVFSQLRYFKPDIHLIITGLLGAVVAVSSGAPVLPPWAAVLIGALAGFAVALGVLLMDVMFRIDDPMGGIAIHGLGALIGVVLTPIFIQVEGMPFTDRLWRPFVQLLGLLAIGAISAALSFGLWFLLKRFTKLRVSEADEFDGLDLVEHDIGAYPDFQQNSIKSYHLREV